VPQSDEYIASMAMRTKDGRIITGRDFGIDARTHDQLWERLTPEQQNNISDWEGVVTNKGRYLTREEAATFQGKPGEILDATELYGRGATKTDAYQELLQGFTNKLFGVGTGEAFDPKMLKRNLKKYGQDFLIEAYGVEGYSALRRAADSGLHILLAEPIGAQYLRTITRPDTIDLSFIVDNIIGASSTPTAARKLAPNLTLLRNILDKPTFNALSEVYLERLFTPEAVTNLVDPVKLSKALRQNERILKLWYPNEKYNQLMKLAEVGARQQSASQIARSARQGETLAAWTTGGVVLRAVAGRSLTSRIVAPIISFGPKQLAKLYLSENGIRFLQQATTLPATSARATELATKLLTIVYGTGAVPPPIGMEGSIKKLERERIKRSYQERQAQQGGAQ
jgi:hypothetical protein